MKLPKKNITRIFVISYIVLFLFTNKSLSGFCNTCQSECIGNCIQQNCIDPCTTQQELWNLAQAQDTCPINNQVCCKNRKYPQYTSIRSVFIPRSQGADTARELIGWQEFIYNPNKIITTGQVLSYTRSYQPELINFYLFNRQNSLNFTGSQVNTTNNIPACSLIADYFGLSTNFQGTLGLSPRIENIIFDNQFFFNLNHWLCGLYARVHFPIVNTRWKLNPCANIISRGNDFPECYMSNTSIPSANNFENALNGTYNYGSQGSPLLFGRFDFNTRDLTKVADIDLILGYNYYQNMYSHLGAYIQVVVPTGNTPNPTFIFNPIVGNGKHWELGIGLSAHKTLWYLSNDSLINIYLEGNFTHMFKSCQLRSFDLCNNGPLGRYLLLREFDADGQTPTGRILPAINITTLPVNTKVNVKGDFTLKLAYQDPIGLNIDFGYNIYAHSPERLSKYNNGLALPTQNKYGIKGTQGTCYLAYTTEGAEPNTSFGSLVTTEPLNSTVSNAQINRIGSIDNPESAPIPAGTDIAVTWNSIQSGNINAAEVIEANLSAPAQNITINSLNLHSGLASGSLTHTLFTYAGYNYLNCFNNIDAYFGLGFKVEFDGKIATERRILENCLTLNEQIQDDFLSSLNQWGIWLKAGISY